MTEQEWLEATDPQPMLDFLLGKASERKFRLFAVAACRRIWHLLTHEASRRAVEAAEQYADGLATSAELATAWADAKTLVHQVGILNVFAACAAFETSSSTISPDVQNPLRIGGKTLIQQIAHYAVVAVKRQYKIRESRTVSWTRQSSYLRCIFGPLAFRTMRINPDWLTWHDGLMLSMARQMYDRREFRDMPILADALEEAGCTNSDILAHCRSGGEHVRGCWVIDALLGKL